MKLAAICCTFRRPHTLGQLVESFLRQDYPSELRELVILDDAGQYENQSGIGWRLVSIPTRFRSPMAAPTGSGRTRLRADLPVGRPVVACQPACRTKVR